MNTCVTYFACLLLHNRRRRAAKALSKRLLVDSISPTTTGVVVGGKLTSIPNTPYAKYVLPNILADADEQMMKAAAVPNAVPATHRPSQTSHGAAQVGVTSSASAVVASAHVARVKPAVTLNDGHEMKSTMHNGSVPHQSSHACGSAVGQLCSDISRFPSAPTTSTSNTLNSTRHTGAAQSIPHHAGAALSTPHTDTVQSTPHASVAQATPHTAGYSPMPSHAGNMAPSLHHQQDALAVSSAAEVPTNSPKKRKFRFVGNVVKEHVDAESDRVVKSEFGCVTVATWFVNVGE